MDAPHGRGHRGGEHDQKRIIRDVFVHVSERHQGKRIRGFRKAFYAAVAAAGHPGVLLHDLRRSGVRSLIGSGVPERVAMEISGHKTRAIFDRYNIVSDGDLREAARRRAQFGHTQTVSEMTAAR